MNNPNWLSSTMGLMLMPLIAFSQAPVVDDSENFKLLENQPAPISRTSQGAPIVYGEHERPLAQDDTPTQTNPANGGLMLDKVQGLQQEIQELRGQLEVQSHELKALKEQQLAFYKDLDDRIRGQTALKAPQETPQVPQTHEIAPEKPMQQEAMITPSVQTAAPGNPADEQVAYLAAYELIQTKQFSKAAEALNAFIQRYPQGGYTANAHYWLGEVYLTQNQPKEAIQHFDTVLKQFPHSAKASASLLKLGYAYAANGQIPEARTELQNVLKNYPDTPTAKLALAKLSTLPRS